MHPVANMVELDTTAIEEAFVRAAVPEFTGSVKVHIRLLPTAAHEVEFISEKHTNKLVEVPGTVREKLTPHVTNSRVVTVRYEVAELKKKLRLSVSVIGVTGHFMNGELKKIELHEVQ
jgi:DNA replicative helicase MCM subunit Mcm2 (Cdc46/Mcm family)